MRRPNFEARTLCEVSRINLDGTKKRATGVTYVDSSGEEWEQPADLVLLCAFQLFNVHLLLISGVGAPYESEHRTRHGRPQLFLPGDVERQRLLAGQVLQSFHCVGCHRILRRRIQRRQLRP
jgi:hypothetical protein